VVLMRRKPILKGHFLGVNMNKKPLYRQTRLFFCLLFFSFIVGTEFFRPLWAFAGVEECTVCLENHNQADEEEDGKVPVQKRRRVSEDFLSCKDRHKIYLSCLQYRLETFEDLENLVAKGLRCFAEDCRETHSLDKIYSILDSRDRDALKDRIEKATSTKIAEMAENEAIRLRDGIERSFSFQCPVDGCGYSLGPIEGCNAAFCSNQECKSIGSITSFRSIKGL